MIRFVSLAAASMRAAFEAPTATAASDDGLATATFAGGCFWCVESGFDAVPGAVDTWFPRASPAAMLYPPESARGLRAAGPMPISP